MTDYTWPSDLAPYTVSFYLQPHTGGSESPFSRQTKVYGLSAPRWVCSMAFRGGYWGSTGLEANGPRMDAMVAKLKGRQNRVALYDFRRDSLRAPLWPIAPGNTAAAQGATTMTVTGLPPGTVMLAGDYLGGDGRPHIITDNATANSSGQAVVTFEPPLIGAVGFNGATFGSPTGMFRLTDDDAGNNQTEVGQGIGMTLEFVEDIIATNPNGLAASALLANESDGYVWDATTELTSKAVVKKTAGVITYEESFAAATTRLNALLFPDMLWPAKSVVNQAGATITTTAGDIPYDWSLGARRLKLKGADAIRILTSVCGDPRTVIMQGKWVTGADAFDALLSVYDTAGSTEIRANWTISDANVAGAEYLTMGYKDTALVGQPAHGFKVGQISDLARDGATISIAYSYEANGSAAMFSINGEPTLYDPTATSIPAADVVELFPDANLTFYLERLIILPRTMSANELPNAYNAARYHPYVKAAINLGNASTGVNTDLRRFPQVLLINNTGAVATFLTTHQERGNNGTHVEQPQRIRQQIWNFDGTTWTSPTTDSSVILQSTVFSYTAGDGGVGNATYVKRTYGPFKGRIYRLTDEMTGGTGNQDGNDVWTMNLHTSDDNGTTWTSSGVALHGETAFGVGVNAYGGVAAHGVEYSASGLYPNRLVFSFWTDDAGYKVGLLILTEAANGTVTFATSNRITTANNPSESAIALRGTAEQLVQSIRVELDDVRYWATSDNGGTTLVLQGAQPSFVGAYVAASMKQIDPGRVIGSNGRLVLGRADRTGGDPRDGVLMTFYEGTTLAPLDEVTVLSHRREYSYLGGIEHFELNGQPYMVFAVETGVGGYNTKASSHLVAIRPPIRGARALG